MGRLMSSLVVVVAAVGFPAAARSASSRVYDLRKVPRFAPGDVVTRMHSETYRSTFADREGEPTREMLIVVDATESQRVTKVDEAHRVTGFLDRVESATMKTTRKYGGKAIETGSVELSDVWCLVRRSGRTFRTDTTTIASRTVRSLTASRLGLLKRFFHDRMAFHAWTETNALLMPPTPVRVGGEWEPEAKALKLWYESGSRGRKLKIDRPAGTFQLVSVRGGVALVRGTVTFAFRLGETPARARMNLSCRIDTATGRWLTQSVNSQLTADMGDLVFRMNVTAAGTMVFRPGAGERPATAPAKLYDLGWAPPPRDTNRYRNRSAGVSIDVPPTWRPTEVPKDDPVVAAFESDNNRGISITVRDAHRPMDMDELLPTVVSNLHRAIPNYLVLEKRGVALVGNVPAALITGEGHNGSHTIVTLVAIDGMRLVSVSAGVRGDRPGDVAELKRIVKTLRVFEPDLSGKE